MDDRINVVLSDDLSHQVLIGGVAEDKWHVLGDGPVKASRQIVEYNDLFAGIGQLKDHVTADVAGTASYQD